MVSEGLIEEDKLHSFNIPNYMPSTREITTLIKEEGSFIIDDLQTFEIHWSAHKKGSDFSKDLPINEVGFGVMKAMRAVLEPLLLDHFHEWILDEIFSRFQSKITNCMSTKEKTTHFNIVVSMKRKSN